MVQLRFHEFPSATTTTFLSIEYYNFPVFLFGSAIVEA